MFALVDQQPEHFWVIAAKLLSQKRLCISRVGVSFSLPLLELLEVAFASDSEAEKER